MTFAAIAMMASAAVMMVSCGSDDDGDKNEPEKPSVAKTAIINYVAEINQDLSNLMEVELIYLDNGEKKIAKLQNNRVELAVKAPSLPAKFAYELKLTKRNNVEVDTMAVYSFEIGIGTGYTTYDSNDKEVAQLAAKVTWLKSSFDPSKRNTGLTEERLYKYIERLNNKPYAYELPVEGQPVLVEGFQW